MDSKRKTPKGRRDNKWKVLVYDMAEDKKKIRTFSTEREARHYAMVLGQAAFQVPNPPKIYIDVMPV